ncbi:MULTISPECIES: metal-sensing transcriptional repressor [Paenibacillus]|uniref:Copper-sensing transcriptional repressor CsoR n=1 Tax=Paenibacillus illinoisensis TaxID=59845 RepID=A0A2W0CFN5_9BACL|nr:metal-sensing transcriptional repressor [Paenibacillus illinoisensis]PYY27155.1 Copper-sensing transcriptional repressor CsoR [Paenibacillus illinoisensis]
MPIRLNRIEGKIRRIKGLIEKDNYCDQVLNQISAAEAGLNDVSNVLLRGRIEDFVVDRDQ